MAFPSTIKIEDLKKTHEGFDADQIALYQAMYDGGYVMEPFKKDLLYMREMERLNAASGMAQFIERVAKAPYIRRISGFEDWLVAAVFLDLPEVVVDEALLPSKKDQEYYTKLNDDADSLGTPLPVMMRETVLECCNHRRAYPMVEFPQDMVNPRDAASKDGKFKLLKAGEVEDWQHNTEGVLQWVRCHKVELVRPKGQTWAVPDRERHIWAFIGEEETVFYEAYKKINGVWETPDGDSESAPEARKFRVAKYNGGLPAFEVRFRSGQWIMNTCYDVARAAFNRDASIEYLGDKFAFQVLVIMTDRNQLDDIVLADLGAIKLRAGESANFIAPAPGVLDPLFKSSEKLQKDLLDSIHASAQNAASIPQAGRLSGDAVEKMREPLHVLLYSFAWPVLDAYNSVLKRIIELRGDPEGCATIKGFGEFDAEWSDMEESQDGEGENRRPLEYPRTGNADGNGRSYAKG